MKIRDKRAAAFFAAFSGDEISATADEVVMSESDRIDTGLLDQWGEPLFRTRAPVGFEVPK